MSAMPPFLKNPQSEAAPRATEGVSSNRSGMEQWLCDPRVAFWAAVVAMASFVPYLAALGWYMAAGFSPPPPTMTRALASASIIICAPALVVLVASLAAQSRSTATVAARLAMVFILSFAVLATLTRIVQGVVILGGGAGESPLDLYVTNSPAQWIEFFAWGPCLGLALLFTSRLFAAGGRAAWARWLFALAGIFSLVGGAIAMLGDLLSSSSLQSLGLRICLPGWTILLFAALAFTAWLVRRPGRRVNAA